MITSHLFRRYEPAILGLPLGQPYTRRQLLGDDKFLLHRESNFEMYYAPHNEYVNSQAQVVMVGISPGWIETEMAFRIARTGLHQGLTREEIGKRVKLASQFAGTTRANLVMMLNRLGLHHKLHISDCGDLFDDNEGMMYATAMLGYPVFTKGKNYNGHSPTLQAAPFLKKWAVRSLGAELIQMERPLVIPLGKAVEEVLRLLVDEGLVEFDQCLWGFPHPSGANGHRHSQFALMFGQMKEAIAGFTWRLAAS